MLEYKMNQNQTPLVGNLINLLSKFRGSAPFNCKVNKSKPFITLAVKTDKGNYVTICDDKLIVLNKFKLTDPFCKFVKIEVTNPQDYNIKDVLFGRIIENTLCGFSEETFKVWAKGYLGEGVFEKTKYITIEGGFIFEGVESSLRKPNTMASIGGLSISDENFSIGVIEKIVFNCYNKFNVEIEKV